MGIAVLGRTLDRRGIFDRALASLCEPNKTRASRPAQLSLSGSGYGNNLHMYASFGRLHYSAICPEVGHGSVDDTTMLRVYLLGAILMSG